MSRRRRPYAGGNGAVAVAEASASEVSPGYVQRASGNGSQQILDILALSNTQLPAYDQYWMMYTKQPIVATCVDMIANSVSADGYDIVAKKGFEATDVTKDQNAQLIDEFFDIAFVNKDTMRRALYSLTVDIKVFGVGYWRKKRAGGMVVGLERYDPRYVIPKPTPDRKAIAAFLVRQHNLMGVDPSGNPLPAAPWSQTIETIRPQDMIFFTLGGGDQLLGAPSPLEKLDHTLGIDFAIRRYRQSFFNNGAIIGKILTSAKANREQARAVESMIANSKRGVDNAFKTMVLLGDWKVDDKGNPSGQQDFDFVKGSDLNTKEICSVYGVPTGRLWFSGTALGSSGKEQDDQTYQEGCILPLEEAIYEILTRDLLVNEFDIKNLEMAPKRRATLRFDMFSAASTGLQVGMTGNESRELVGLQRILDNPLMDEPMFLSSRGMSLEAEMPVAPAAPTEPGNGGSDELGGSNDQMNQNESKKNAPVKKKARSWY